MMTDKAVSPAQGPAAVLRFPRFGFLISITPGFALSAGVAVAAYVIAGALAPLVPIPGMVMALVIGIALNSIATKPIMEAGITFCVKSLLRAAVALLGLRIALSDIAALGMTTGLLIVLAMLATLCASFALARWNNQPSGFGALTGAAVAVCGASAALAASTVVPNYPGKQADLVFVVVGANALATVAMVLYPPICALLNFDTATTGVLLGSTIHDVAQVVGAGYAVSEAVGNTAVIVKLFRVFLLLPVVLLLGWYFKFKGEPYGQAKVPVPLFAIMFLLLCLLNSALSLAPQVQTSYAIIKKVCVELSSWGLLIAIGALGLGTSISAIRRLGWRHVATITGISVLLLAAMTAGLFSLARV
jgi:uncharacterized integral membrane protein (TIGR00698 family)